MSANSGGLHIRRKGDKVALRFIDTDTEWTYEFTMAPALAYEAARRITMAAMRVEDGVPPDDDEHDDEEYDE